MGIADLVQESVNDHSAPLWWPGLAAALASDRLARLPFDPPRYSTSHFVGNLEPERTQIIASNAGNSHISLRIERMPAILEKRFVDQGLTLDNTPDFRKETLQLFVQSMALINLAPSLGAAVSTLVRSVHLLTVEDPNIDVSFSDPEIPFSIFVSVSVGPEGDIRLAEAIIHEAMHLQLSLVERQIPLVDGRNASLYSPWKGEARPLAGIVHGLYVFRVIEQWLGIIATQSSRAPYIARRRSQIAGEVQLTQIADSQLGLTSFGRQLVSRLMEV